MANKVAQSDKLEDMKDDRQRWIWHTTQALVDLLNSEPQNHDMYDDTDVTTMAITTNLMVDVINSQPENKRSRLLVGVAMALAVTVKGHPLELGYALARADALNRERLLKDVEKFLPEEAKEAIRAMGGAEAVHMHFRSPPEDEEPPPTKH